MNTVINIKTDLKVKKEAQKTAKELGLSLSAVLNAYLRQFVYNKTLFVSSKYEMPSDFLISALKESRKDLKTGRVKKMNQKEAIDTLDKIIKN